MESSTCLVSRVPGSVLYCCTQLSVCATQNLAGTKCHARESAKTAKVQPIISHLLIGVKVSCPYASGPMQGFRIYILLAPHLTEFLAISNRNPVYNSTDIMSPIKELFNYITPLHQDKGDETCSPNFRREQIILSFISAASCIIFNMKYINQFMQKCIVNNFVHPFIVIVFIQLLWPFAKQITLCCGNVQNFCCFRTCTMVFIQDNGT